jgi:hypothetical protein
MPMIKSMVENKLRMLGIKSIKKTAICQYLNNGARKNLFKVQGEQQRVLKFGFQFPTGINGV